VHNTAGGIKAQHDKVITDAMTGWIIKGNKIVANTSSQLFFDFRSNWNDFQQWFATIDSNYYARVGTDNNAIVTNYFQGSTTNYNLSTWKTYISGETHSVRTNISDISKLIFKTNASRFVPKDYQVCASCVGLDGTTVTNKFSLTPFTSNIFIGQ
jgi:hypothetical protein